MFIGFDKYLVMIKVAQESHDGLLLRVAQDHGIVIVDSTPADREVGVSYHF